MTTAVANAQASSALMEQVLISGDLAKLNSADRVMYYTKVCESVGLNPLTKPFEYIQLNGKLTLYAKRDCTDQLRSINGVSIIIVSREVVEGCYVVTARATDKHGRNDESIGAVPIDGLKGENRSNAMMKAETKAKRRVTLSVCGLGLLDETEISSIPGAYPQPSNKITPMAGAGETLVSEEVNRVDSLYLKVVEWLNASSVGDAYAEIDNAELGAEEKTYLWSRLDSGQRRALKDEGEKVRAKLAGLPPPEKLISDAQRKRLEARIKEYGLERDVVKAEMEARFQKDHFAELALSEYEQLDTALEAMKPAEKPADSFVSDYVKEEAK